MKEVRVLLFLQNSHIFFSQTMKLLVIRKTSILPVFSQRILLIEDSEGKAVGPRAMFVWFALKEQISNAHHFLQYASFRIGEEKWRSE